tara:strand:+ start:233 stop:430 length:198 start_codon:yes stop_codon:yes gene_type:complete
MKLEESKKDIASFIRNNEVVVKCFADLHNYFDANMYVEHCLTNTSLDVDKANSIIDKLDNFIKSI